MHLLPTGLQYQTAIGYKQQETSGPFLINDYYRCAQMAVNSLENLFGKLLRSNSVLTYSQFYALEDLTKGSKDPGSKSFLRILIGI